MNNSKKTSLIVNALIFNNSMNQLPYFLHHSDHHMKDCQEENERCTDDHRIFGIFIPVENVIDELFVESEENKKFHLKI